MKPSEVIRICISIKGIATMNPINAKACNSLSCTLLIIVYYLYPYRNHLTS